MSDYSCPFCDYATDDARALIQHLALAPVSHAVLAELTLKRVENEIQARWSDD